MKTMRTTVLVLSALACTGLGGCISINDTDLETDSANRVTSAQMQSLLASNRQLEIGMDKGDALALYPPHLTSLVSSASIEGHRVEEWRVDAVRNDGDVHFRRYLYFTDGTLSEFGDSRLDYRNNPAVHSAWFAGEGGS